MLSVFLAPHQNCRYQASLEQLSLAEMQIMLKALNIDAEIERRTVAGRTALCLDPDIKEDEAIGTLRRMASVYMICRGGKDGALYPAAGTIEPFIGADLSGILKYKGKTNETFTHLLLNIALYSSKFYACKSDISILDPVCGKGTTLLEALNMGFNSVGVDLDDKGAVELNTFVRRYMTYNKRKHIISQSSLTLNGAPVRAWTLETSQDAVAWKAGDRRKMRVITCDTLCVDRIFGKQKYNMIVGDLPYGVQHAAYATDSRATAKRKNSLSDFTSRAIAVWSKQLSTGGSMALSFNTYTLKREFVRDAMSSAGLEVLEGGAYDQMEHWVEQAVNRDVAVAVKR